MDRLKPPPGNNFQETCLQYFWCLSERGGSLPPKSPEETVQETGLDMTNPNPNNGIERVGKDIGAVFAKEELSDLYPEKSDTSYSKVNIPQAPMVPYLFVPPNRPAGAANDQNHSLWWRQFQTNPPFQFNPAAARFMFPPATGTMNTFGGFQHDMQSCAQAAAAAAAAAVNPSCEGGLVPKVEPDAYGGQGTGMEQMSCDSRDSIAYANAKSVSSSQPNHSPSRMSEASDPDPKMTCNLSPHPQAPPTPKIIEGHMVDHNKWQPQQPPPPPPQDPGPPGARVTMGCAQLARDFQPKVKHRSPRHMGHLKVQNSAMGGPVNEGSVGMGPADGPPPVGSPSSVTSDEEEANYPGSIGGEPTPGSSQGYLLVCNFCGRIFMTRQEFDIHKKSHSMEENMKQRFPEVTFSCKSIHDLFVKRPAEQKPFVCKLCGKACRTEEMCGSHLKCHLGEKPYQCVFCGKRFMHRETCSRHEKTHTGEQPYRCELCPRTFVGKEDLQSHLQLHAEGKLFRCEYCGNTFLRKPYLVVHLRTHTGEKPYKCKVCGRGFTQRQCCTYHERIHTGEKHYKCHVCGKSYSCHGSFKKHMRRHTGV